MSDVRRIVKRVRTADGAWRIIEMITKRVARKVRRRFHICGECNRPIMPGMEYYSDRLPSKFLWGWHTGWHQHKRTSHYGPYFAPTRQRRFYTHNVCEKCWRGEKLNASGGTTKFIDRTESGVKVFMIPFRTRSKGIGRPKTIQRQFPHQSIPRGGGG